ncbi:glycosyltransferase family 4 protein [Corynebacterium sp. H128]|uniref:glycosyltransferase family 4 protein n=1 Tax=unclassified Corynebacterium TaxID=2624378 RepID=UPI0030A40AEF
MKVLLVTNDFPPTIGGIQSYVRDFLATLDPRDVIVFASTQDALAAAAWDAESPYTVVRWPHRVMLPTPATAREMARLIREHEVDTIWFGAAAPLALMAGQARAAGARKIVASTHGHEVGWSMLPVARQCLGVIGQRCDVVTYISEYTRRRLARPFGRGTRFAHLPSGVAADAFLSPAPEALAAFRQRWGLESGPVVSCISRLVPRKGQDALIKVWPKIRERFPAAQLLIVGDGSYCTRLKKMAGNGVVFTGRVSDEERLCALAISDVFAMPARTRGWGLDVEGLGIVYLEAQAARCAVIAGNSGGAPETVTPESGRVIDGRNLASLEHELLTLLSDGTLRAAMGEAGLRNVRENWTWEQLGARFQEVLRP